MTPTVIRTLSECGTIKTFGIEYADDVKHASGIMDRAIAEGSPEVTAEWNGSVWKVMYRMLKGEM